MERVTKKMVVVVLLVVCGFSGGGVQGGRLLKEKAVEPQNYFGSFGGTGALVPTPFGPAIALGPSGFCSFPGVGCVRVQPTVPGGGSPPSPPSVSAPLHH